MGTHAADAHTADALRAQLNSRRRLLADGAMGTMLIAMGLEVGRPPEEWNLQRPDAVIAVARAYVEAGAELITSNTFGGNRLRLRDCGLENQFEAINRVGVQLAREAAYHRVFVVGSIGPARPPSLRGEARIDPEASYSVYAEQACELESAGVCGLLLETFTDLEECRGALKAVRSVVDVPVMASVTLNAEGALLSGERPDLAARSLAEAGAEAIGLNCGSNPAIYMSAIQAMATVDLPLLAMPSGGLPTRRGDQFVYELSPPDLAELGREMWEAGATIVGGCCGTTPNHIRALRETLPAAVPT